MREIKVKCPAKTTSALDEQCESVELCRPELVSGSQQLQVKCPAKINLTLEVINKREDGFHNIQSIMQTIDLYDILTIKVEENKKFDIKLSGTSNEIPYDEKNLVHKATKLFFEKIMGNLTPMFNYSIQVHIEKNIPIAAGLAGGSTDAAGTLWGLNKLFDNMLTSAQIHELCASLGSDLNFCLEGGCQSTTSRGEILEALPFQEFRLSLIKPNNLGISAKEAYTKFSQLEHKPNLNMTQKLKDALNSGNADIKNYLQNDLEIALLEDYAQLKELKDSYPGSLMSGSGSTFFVLDDNIKPIEGATNSGYWVKTGLKSIPHGVTEV